MRHADALPLLAELEQGQLGEESRTALAAHCASCAECQGSSEAYRAIAAHLRHARNAASGEHPASETIVAYGVDPESLETRTLSAITAHLSQCPSCAREVEATRQGHEMTRTKPATFPGWLLENVARLGDERVRPALAAAAVLLVLGYPAFLGLVRLPAQAEEVERLRQSRAVAEREILDLRSALDGATGQIRRSHAWSGPIELHVLDSPSRRSELPKTLRVGPDQPYLLIGVLPPLPRVTLGTDFYRFQIDRVGSGSIWYAELTAAQIREGLDRSGVILFPIRTSQLPPGRYELAFSRRGAPRREALLRVAFTVASSG